MKKGVYLSFIFLFNCFFSFSQVFSNSSVSTAGSWNGTLTKTITVSGLSNLNAGVFELVQVNLHMGDDANTRNYNTYKITLTKGTTSIDLVATGGLPNSQIKQINTKFRFNQYLRRLFEHGGTAEPFNIGYYRSQDNYTAFNGIDPNGVWTVTITETSSATGGRFNNVDLVFKSPYTVQDYTSLTSYDNCSTPYCLGTAEIIVASNNEFTNQAGDMFNPNTVSCNWNAAQNNSAWFKFRAAQTSLGITISGITGNLQILAIDAGIDNNPCTSSDNIVLSGGCPTSSVNDTYSSPQYTNGSTKNNQLNLSGLTIGKFYYFIVDGSGASVSPFYIETKGTSLDCSNCQLNAVVGTNSPVCENQSLNLTCNDGVSWAWTGPNGFTSSSQNPTINNVTQASAGTYTVVVTDINGCSDTKSINVVISTSVIPTFNTPSPVCTGSTLNPLPTISNNGIEGSWSPALNNAATTTYTFNPDAGQCATSTTITITVNNCDFGAYATAIWMDDCTDLGDGKFYNTTGSGTDLVNQEPGNTFIKDFGVHLANSSSLMLRGAEVKTFKNGGTNVCGAKMYYRFYLTSGIAGTFTSRNLSFFSECNTGTNEFINGGGPCIAGQQKWQCVSQTGCDTPVNLTTVPPGDYTLEVYYDVTGDFNSTSQCDDTIILNNGGTNYKANFSIIASPTLSISNPTTCNGTNGSITISGLTANEVYALSYNFNSTPIGPINFNTNNNGEILIPNLGIGTYSNFSFVINSCNTILSSSVSLQNPIITPVFSTPDPFCFSETIPETVLPSTSNNGIAGNWSPAINNTATTNYTFTPNAGQCANSTNLSVVINPEITGTTNSNPNTVCNASSTDCTPSGTHVVINEVMHFPLTAQGLVVNGTEYIELYNPTCSPIDLSCYTIATAAKPNSNPGSTLSRGGTILIPSGTILAPKSHYVIGTSTSSSNIANIDYNTTLTSNYCVINQFVLANGDGWISLNDSNGTPLDAIYWTVGANESSKITTDDDLDDAPCIPSSLGACNTGSLTLLSAKEIHQLNPSLINYVGQTTLQGLSSTGNTFSRIPDGAAWQRDIPGSINLINCNNGSCDTSPISSCNGTATVTVTEGSGNYSYLWNDPQAQTTATATNLCAGSYCVTVTDLDTNCTQQFCVTVNDDITNITPTFSFGTTLSICSGGVVPTLPTTSSNSITGTWSPAIVDNANNGTYTFTPDAGQCATTTTFTVTVTPQTIPTFSFGTASTICSGGTVPTLPLLSDNSISGSWLPAVVDNANNGIYTFTPDTGQCATTTTFTVTITPQTTPIFSFGTSLTACQGDVSAQVLLPTLSDNSISGSWNPSTIDYSLLGQTIYTFTTNAGQCATSTTLTVTITPQTTPIFSFGTSLSICSAGVVPTLPTTSGNSITGVWSPSVVDNVNNGTYTFTPDSGQCANETTFTVTITPQTTPTFTFGTSVSLCSGGVVPTLPTTSGNSITGVWSPSVVDNVNNGTYTFTPDSGQCANETTFTVTITPQTTPTFTFGTSLTACQGDVSTQVLLPNLSNNSVSGSWNPSTIDYSIVGQTVYTFTPNAGQCALNTTLTVTINPTPQFTITGGCDGEDYVLQIAQQNQDIIDVKWYYNNDLIGQGNSVVITDEGVFTAVATNANNCESSADITITNSFCSIPKGVSANNDGDNDFFELSNLDVKKLQIFNRYGMVIYTKNNYTNEWGGQSDTGDQVPDGTYYYVIEQRSGKVKTGWVYLIRQR
ncbi:gliding motility-associated C-terminal domain-containing protein [Flavobacterium macrobrachii]|nr:gliding motility-associated C-terminal domain-containing protein [Flavobacterium macrobrachii]